MCVRSFFSCFSFLPPGFGRTIIHVPGVSRWVRSVPDIQVVPRPVGSTLHAMADRGSVKRYLTNRQKWSASCIQISEVYILLTVTTSYFISQLILKMDTSSLFRVDGMVAVVTGGGTGEQHRFILINSSTHQLINSSTHQLINSSTHQLINSSTHQLILGIKVHPGRCQDPPLSYYPKTSTSPSTPLTPVQESA
jgi:hypothetical protein